MNFLSLPDEMAARVLKYTNYATVNRIRKMNARTNNVAKSFEIGMRFPVTSIRFINSSWFDHISILPELVMNLDIDALNCYPNLTRNNVSKFAMRSVGDNFSLLKTADKIFKKIEILKNRYKDTGLHCTLHFANTRLPFDDSFLALLANNRKTFRNMSMFILLDSTVTCTAKSMRDFIGSTKKLRAYQIQHCDITTDVLYQAEMLENRYWDSINLYYGNSGVDFKCSTLNDKFLLNVVKNCRECKIVFHKEGYIAFTVDGVIEMIEYLIKERITPALVCLEPVMAENSQFGKVEDRIRAIHTGLVAKFKSHSYSTRDGTNRFITKNHTRICFPENPEEVVVEFNMVHVAYLDQHLNLDPADD